LLPKIYGLVNYYLPFIKHFSATWRPIVRSISRVVRWEGTKEAANTTENGVSVGLLTGSRAITWGPVLIQPDDPKPYTIETASSDFAHGMALLLTYPVAFEGRKLQDAELNHPTYEKE
jgi:hypothetical protein